MVHTGEAGPVLETQPVQEAPRPRRLGGWLILALVTLFAFPLQLVAVFIPAWIAVHRHGFALIWEQDPHWALVTGWNIAATGAMSMLSLFTVPQFWRKRSVTRKLMIAFYVGAFLVGIVNYVISAATAARDAPPPDMSRVMISTAIAAAWISYFSKSKRVRETFVLP